MRMVGTNSTSLQCVSWELMPPMLLETVLVGVIIWRTIHQIYWKSRARRVILHYVLLLSGMLRLVFWMGMCNPSIVHVGGACLWWSNSLVLVCTAAVIFQWSSAVTAGRGTPQQVKRSKRITMLNLLVFLHSVHLIWSTFMGIHIMVYGFQNGAKMMYYAVDAAALMLTFRVLNIAVLAFDAVAACYVAVQLRKRVLSAAMTVNMKKKSVTQMALLMTLLTVSVTLQIIIDVPVIISGFRGSWFKLSFAGFSILKYCIPGFVLSLDFLYIMRRVEKPPPPRMVVVPPQSLVMVVDCPLPDCMWCAHHRRYDLNQNKCDVSLRTSFSPRTVDSSYHSQETLSPESWPCGSTPDLHEAHHHISRDSHHRLQQEHQAHLAHQARGHLPFPTQTHGYVPLREIPGRRGASCS